MCFLPKRRHAACHHWMLWSEREGQYETLPAHVANGQQHQHERDGAVWSGRCPLYCPDKWHPFGCHPDHHHLVSCFLEVPGIEKRCMLGLLRGIQLYVVVETEMLMSISSCLVCSWWSCKPSTIQIVLGLQLDLLHFKLWSRRCSSNRICNHYPDFDSCGTTCT